MMNLSKIDWCDLSWNPVTGCRHSCEYCYARKQARRFCGDVRINKGSDQIAHDGATDTYVLSKPFHNDSGTVTPFPVGFEPVLHEYRLSMPAQRKKPANIFVCSMADLFGEWVPDEWIQKVFKACQDAPQHNYLFLTKNPKRYYSLLEEGQLPKQDNFWYGSTITDKKSRFFDSFGYNTFLSIEPLREFLDVGLGSFSGVEWIIIGAETGQSAAKVTPKREWIQNIIETARITQAYVFMKDSKELRSVWGKDLIQNLPCELEHLDDETIPKCKQCEYCDTYPDGERGTRSYCGKMKDKHIFGRYTRTSPPWCPDRRANKKE